MHHRGTTIGFGDRPHHDVPRRMISLHIAVRPASPDTTDEDNRLANSAKGSERAPISLALIVERA